MEEEQTTIVVEPSPFNVVPPLPSDIDDLKQFLLAQRDSLTQRVQEIESQLGFIVSADELAVRVAKIELFLGIKG